MQIGDVYRSGSIKAEIVDITGDYVYARALNGKHKGEVCREDRDAVEKSLNAGRTEVVERTGTDARAEGGDEDAD